MTQAAQTQPKAQTQTQNPMLQGSMFEQKQGAFAALFNSVKAVASVITTTAATIEDSFGIIQDTVVAHGDRNAAKIAAETAIHSDITATKLVFATTKLNTEVATFLGNNQEQLNEFNKQKKEISTIMNSALTQRQAKRLARGY